MEVCLGRSSLHTSSLVSNGEYTIATQFYVKTAKEHWIAVKRVLGYLKVPINYEPPKAYCRNCYCIFWRRLGWKCRRQEVNLRIHVYWRRCRYQLEVQQTDVWHYLLPRQNTLLCQLLFKKQYNCSNSLMTCWTRASTKQPFLKTSSPFDWRRINIPWPNQAHWDHLPFYPQYGRSRKDQANTFSYWKWFEDMYSLICYNSSYVNHYFLVCNYAITPKDFENYT